MKRLNNENGLSLLELLAAIMISTIIVAVGYNLLMTSMKTGEKIKVQTEMRDEADHIMGNLIESFYLTKTSDVDDSNLPVKDELIKSIKLKNGDLIGFSDVENLNDEASMKIHVIQHSEANEIELLNNTFRIDPEKTRIKVTETNAEGIPFQYKIILHLEQTSGPESNRKRLETESEISLINDL